MRAGHALTTRGVTLRPARDGDRPFERTLFETARPDAVLLAAWPDDARRAFLDQQFEFQTRHYARAHPDAERLIVQIAGAAAGRLILQRAPAAWRIIDIALVPRWRGAGIGTLLMQTVLAEAEEAAAGAVHLAVDPRNPARRLYERLGFVASGGEENAASIAMRWRPGPRPQLKTA
ncbi:MAG TPA: GNAT family N-acetyltransferase [Pseudolabrys sp.]|nr:GNAT family N-acetyltransferase [Pseudolabrys sp.]